MKKQKNNDAHKMTSKMKGTFAQNRKKSEKRMKREMKRYMTTGMKE